MKVRDVLRPLPSSCRVALLLLLGGATFATDPALAVEPSPVQAAPAATASPAPSAAVADAAFEFVVAKLLVDEGDYRGAAEAFRRALELDPGADYVRIEFSELLSRMGRFARTRGARLERLHEAVRESERALRDLPDNPDALRAVATANLALASEATDDPAPMAAAIAALERVREVDPSDVRSLLNLGHIYLRRGEPGAAADVLTEIVREVPGYRPVYRLLAEALMQAGRREEAVDALAEVLADEPESESVRLALGEVLAELGRHAEAAEVLGGGPGPLAAIEGRSRLATELYLTGDLDGALAELDRLIEDAPDNRYVRLLRGLVLSAQARNAEALATLEPLLDDSGPGGADLAVTVSQLLLREEREDEALGMLRSALTRLETEGPAEEAAEVRLALARLYGSLGRWPQVVDTLAPLVASDRVEERRPAIVLYADALVEQERGEEALALMDSLSSGAENAEIRAKRAEVLARLGRDTEALGLLEEARAGGSEDFLGVAEGLQRAGRFEQTIEPLRRFLATSPGSTPGRFLLGAAQERSGSRNDAVATFTLLIDDHPDFHPALNYLGYLWIEEGENLPRAMDLVRRAVELDPDNGAYIDSLGWGLYQLGEYEEARETLERATRLVQDATVYEHLGDAYAVLGQAESARRAYRRAMELEADDPEAVARKLSELDAAAGDARPTPDDGR